MPFRSGRQRGVATRQRTDMHPRQKKLIIVLAAPVFLFAYVLFALALSDHVPGHWLTQLIFYILVGTLWAFPLKPVFIWANRPQED